MTTFPLLVAAVASPVLGVALALLLFPGRALQTDYALIQWATYRAITPYGAAVCWRLWHMREMPHTERWLRVAWVCSAEAGMVLLAFTPDRKSTRLNSSH